MGATFRRVHTPLFVAICILGAFMSVALGAFEVSQRPPVEVRDPVDERRGLVSIVQVEVTNRSGVARCPEIRIAARDRDDRDLEERVATPDSGVERLEPGATQVYRAEFTDLSAEDYDEELKEFAAFVWEAPKCP